MNIRKVEEFDFENIKKLVFQVHKLHVISRPDIFNDIDPFDKSYFDFLLTDNKTISLICEIDNETVGFCVTTIREPSKDSLVKSRCVAYIEDLCVDEKSKKLGIGKALFNETKKISKNMGADSLELMVWSFNESALKFYEHMGMTYQSIIMEEKL